MRKECVKSGFQRRVEFTPTTRFGQAPPGHHQAGYAVVGACPVRRWPALGCAALSDASWTVADSSTLAPRRDRRYRSPQGAVPSRAGCIADVSAPTAARRRRRGTSPASTRCGISVTPACPTRRPPAHSSGSPPVFAHRPLSLPRRRTTAGHPAHRQVGALIQSMECAIHLCCLRPLGNGSIQRFAIRREAYTGVVADGLPVSAVNTGTFHRCPPSTGWT